MVILPARNYVKASEGFMCVLCVYVHFDISGVVLGSWFLCMLLFTSRLSCALHLRRFRGRFDKTARTGAIRETYQG